MASKKQCLEVKRLPQPNNYKKCNCWSYNDVIKNTPQHTPVAVLDPRPYFDFTTKTVGVDACIAPIIERLWREGIWTRGCCCGHNRDSKSVVLDNPEQIGKAITIILEMSDMCEWRIHANYAYQVDLVISE